MKVYIELQGCDDTTTFPIEVDDEEKYQFLLKLSRESKINSRYGCMPIIEVISDQTSDAWEYAENDYNYNCQCRKEEEREF